MISTVYDQRSVGQNTFLVEKSRPLVVGHRGVPALHQENTLAGFRRAVELGIDAIELDVRLTRDGRAVVCHDEELERLTGEPVRLSRATWAEVSRLEVQRVLPMGIDARGWPVTIEYDAPERIPLLAEVFAEVGDRLSINVELKLDSSPWWQTRVAAVVADEIAAAGLEDRVIVSSFDLRKLRAAKRAYRRLEVGFCFDDSMLDAFRPLVPSWRAHSWLRAALSNNLAGRFLDASFVAADHTLVTRKVVDRIKHSKMPIGTHTLFPLGSTTGKAISPRASSPAEVERLVSIGVDWIETDDPERLLSVLATL